MAFVNISIGMFAKKDSNCSLLWRFKCQHCLDLGRQKFLFIQELILIDINRILWILIEEWAAWWTTTYWEFRDINNLFVLVLLAHPSCSKTNLWEYLYLKVKVLFPLCLIKYQIKQLALVNIFVDWKVIHSENYSLLICIYGFLNRIAGRHNFLVNLIIFKDVHRHKVCGLLRILMLCSLFDKKFGDRDPHNNWFEFSFLLFMELHLVLGVLFHRYVFLLGHVRLFPEIIEALSILQ